MNEVDAMLQSLSHSRSVSNCVLLHVSIVMTAPAGTLLGMVIRMRSSPVLELKLTPPQLPPKPMDPPTVESKIWPESDVPTLRHVGGTYVALGERDGMLGVTVAVAERDAEGAAIDQETV